MRRPPHSKRRSAHRSLCCRLDTLPCEPHALAEMVLSPDERETWLRMRAVEKRRQEWLLGRCAAKDAVRLLVEEYTGVHLVPAEVGIVPDSYGLPQVAGAWTGRLGIQPLVSIAHSHGTAVALAALHSGIRVGIDLENLAARREDFEAIAFRPDERQMLAALPGELRQEWALRMWCAKEAVAKALGRGFQPGHSDLPHHRRGNSERHRPSGTLRSSPGRIPAVGKEYP